jgi:hypothetical protein
MVMRNFHLCLCNGIVVEIHSDSLYQWMYVCNSLYQWTYITILLMYKYHVLNTTTMFFYSSIDRYHSSNKSVWIRLMALC